MIVEVITHVNGTVVVTAYETRDESELQDAVHAAAKQFGNVQDNAVPSEFAAKVKALAGPQ